MSLLVIEVRRALHRRLVRALLGLGLLLVVTAGVIEFVASTDLDLAELAARGHTDPAVMVDWWGPGGADGALSVVGLFLVLGALIGGASVVGAEWRAGTVTTVLTWEPRRTRLHLARVASSALLAALFAVAFQVLVLAAFLPSVLAHGTTAGVDVAWVSGLMIAMTRIAIMVGLAATVGCALAAIARNTAAAIVIAWGWLALGEGLVRGLLPEQARWLIGENASAVITWEAPERDMVMNGPSTSFALLLLYVAVLLAVSVITFERRDVAAA